MIIALVSGLTICVFVCLYLLIKQKKQSVVSNLPINRIFFVTIREAKKLEAITKQFNKQEITNKQFQKELINIFGAYVTSTLMRYPHIILIKHLTTQIPIKERFGNS